MKSIIVKTYCLLTIACALMMCACTDDFLDYGGIIPDGEGSLSATVTFTPSASARLGGTRTPGDVIRDIRELCVLVYTTDGNLVRKYTDKELSGYRCDQNGYVAGDGDHADGNGAHPAEQKTPQATFSIPGLLYGRYRIYAVANMGDMSDYGEAIMTESGLKSISLSWKADNVAGNDQMFGYFTTSGAKDAKGFDAPVIEFRSQAVSIHSWLKRAASKVTVAYDASGLNNGVYIYIKNVTIHDIPMHCYLGENNKPDAPGQLLNRKTDNSPGAAYEPLPGTRIVYDIPGSEHIFDQSVGGIELYNGLRDAATGTPVVKGSDHSETADALFFYENMQGDYEGQQRYDKRQFKTGNDGVGENIREPENDNDYKDRVEYGTYIEVEAYYNSTLNPENPSSGNIRYRFMLGKNITYNYDAQRNYHFKLTLGFKGWANQPDWHIDYEYPEPDLDIPPVFRVSYLYHQKSMMPVRISGNCTQVDMEIVENNWAPCDPKTLDVPAGGSTTTAPDDYSFKWNRAAYENLYLSRQTFTSPDMDAPVTVNTAHKELGFLALNMHDDYKTVNDLPAVIPLKKTENGINVYYDFQDGMTAWSHTEAFYNTPCGTGTQRTASFKADDLALSTSHQKGSPLNNWEVNQVTDVNGNKVDNQKILLVPLWTRAKNIIVGSGFSGNNPYEYYPRKATVKVTATFNVMGKIHTIVKYVTVLQEPRIVNPKGVWRSKGDNGVFHVRLMQAKTNNALSDFQTFNSVGEWTAFVETGSNVSLEKSATTNGEMDGGKIIGRTGTPVDFNIRFNSDGCAVVKVLYHGNNCVHKIFVRQNYEDPITMGGNRWSSYSLFGAVYKNGADGVSDTYTAELTKNPLALGSLFRRGKQSEGIYVSNNNRDNFKPMQAPGNRKFNVYGNRKLTWDEIGFRDDYSNYTRGMGTFSASNGRTYKVPSLADYEALANVCEYGFGVLYGQGATSTAETYAKAYGLQDADNTGAPSDNGTRGIIAYNPSNGDQIFFPVGKNGMGRRRRFNVSDDSYNGTLWYADVNGVLLGKDPSEGKNCFRPVPYNLPIAPGAVYWIDKCVPDGHYEAGTAYRCMGWDMNYFNYDFNSYTANNYRDACPIKLIIK